MGTKNPRPLLLIMVLFPTAYDMNMLLYLYLEMATSSSETLLRALDVGMTEDRVLPNIGNHGN